MASNLPVASLIASDALAGTELFYADGLASAVAADVKVTATQIKTWTSASPTLVTPALGTPSAGVLSSCSAYPQGALTGLGTNVSTALGIAIGSAGAPVTNGGALGSPSSAGTLPAHTLGGTISGGGNQINNVIIGTTTPLAGFFTTISATGDISSAPSAAGAYIGTESTGAYGAIELVGSTGALIDFTSASTDNDGRIIYTHSTDVMAFKVQGGAATFSISPAGALMNGIVQASAQANALCFNSSTGAITYNSGVTTCLASTIDIKDLNFRLSPCEGERIVLAMEPWVYTNKSYPEAGHQLGFVAETVDLIDPRLVSRSPTGKYTGVRYEQYTAVLTAAYQKLHARVIALEQGYVK